MTTPRVFVSSVIEGFADFREAARRGITNAGGDPILVNEDLPAAGASPRNACLDAVESSDIFIILVGERGGYTTPSGKLVVEEEYEHAKARKLPVLVFVKAGARDAGAETLVRLMSDYVDGAFRRSFSSAQELESAVSHALRVPISAATMPSRSPESVQALVVGRASRRNDPVLRLAIGPERLEELIDPVRLGSKEFLQLVFEVGHASEGALLSYACSKKWHIANHCLAIEQTDPDGRHGSPMETAVVICEDGLITIDGSATNRNRSDRSSDVSAMMVVRISDLEDTLGACFRFVDGLFRRLDPYMRHQRWLYNVSLEGLQFRQLSRDVSPQTSHTMSMRNDDPLVALAAPRIIVRADLGNPEGEIQRVVTLLERQAAS